MPCRIPAPGPSRRGRAKPRSWRYQEVGGCHDLVAPPFSRRGVAPVGRAVITRRPAERGLPSLPARRTTSTTKSRPKDNATSRPTARAKPRPGGDGGSNGRRGRAAGVDYVKMGRTKQAGAAMRKPLTIHPPGPDIPLDEAFARIALRVLFAGIVRDERFLAQVHEARKYTPELDALVQMRVPDEVRDWIREQCEGPGIPREAVRSIMRISLLQFRAPGHRDHEGAADTAHCYPFCSPP
jgi:hypothetical protein